MASLRVKIRRNKSNGQVNISLPKKKIPKEVWKRILKKREVKLNLKG